MPAGRSPSTNTAQAVNAPAAIRPTTPAPPIIPSPGAAVLPFSVISAFGQLDLLPHQQRQIPGQVARDLADRPVTEAVVPSFGRHLRHPPATTPPRRRLVARPSP